MGVISYKVEKIGKKLNMERSKHFFGQFYWKVDLVLVVILKKQTATYFVLTCKNPLILSLKQLFCFEELLLWPVWKCFELEVLHLEKIKK